MTHWNTKDKPAEPVRQEISDELPAAGLSISYAPYKSACIYIAMPYTLDKRIDVNDRDGTRRMVLREMLPMAEAALVALRHAVAESLDNGDPRPSAVPSVTAATSADLVADYGSGKTLDMVEFANDMLQGHKQPKG